MVFSLLPFVFESQFGKSRWWVQNGQGRSTSIQCESSFVLGGITPPPQLSQHSSHFFHTHLSSPSLFPSTNTLTVTPSDTVRLSRTVSSHESIRSESSAILPFNKRVPCFFDGLLFELASKECVHLREKTKMRCKYAQVACSFHRLDTLLS